MNRIKREYRNDDTNALELLEISAFGTYTNRDDTLIEKSAYNWFINQFDDITSESRVDLTDLLDDSDIAICWLSTFTFTDNTSLTVCFIDDDYYNSDHYKDYDADDAYADEIFEKWRDWSMYD